MGKYAGSLAIPGIDAPLSLDEAAIRAAAAKFLLAMQEAGRIYRHMWKAKKGTGNFVTEVPWTRPTRRRRRWNCS